MTKEKAIKILESVSWSGYDDNEIAEAVQMGAEALKEKRQHGTWTEELDESANPFFQRRWRCSACNDYNYYGRPDFCPCCGADMREGDPDDRA